MSVPEGVVCEVEAIMASAMPLNTKTDHILHVLTAAGLAHRQKLKPRAFLIHPENRAQSMLSFHDVWMKGASMSMVGFNAKLVEGNTIAFAMSTDPSRRAMQIEKNKALIEQSSGHLAPINGQEGYLTIGGSHTVAYLRCIEAGLSGPAGESTTHPKSDAIWSAISEGWTWVTISSSVEEAIPLLPSFLQSSLNSTNSIQKSITELETAMLLATSFGRGMTMRQAIQHASAADVRCRSSIPAIATFVQRFAGHAGTFPILHFLSNFSKVHGRSVQIGEDMMSLIAGMDFKNPSNMFPMVRTAIWTTLLGCPSASIKDGIARNIVKSDIEKLRSASVIAKTIETESLLLDSWSLHQKQPSQHMDNCFGHLCIRRILHVLNKAPSASIENKTYESLGAIVACFAKEVHEPPSQQKASSASASTDKVMDLISAKPHRVAMLQNSHMSLYTNTKDHGALVFQLVDIQDDGATMRHQGLHDKLIEVHVPLDALKKWRSTKTPMPKACDVAMQSRCLPQSHLAFQEEHQRAMVIVALHAAYEKHACGHASIAFGQHPPSLFTSCPCKKKAIRLVPMGTIAKHKGKEPTKAIHIN
ncbi:unnamed protein product, partial [Symbiodinium microadriaticum]